MKCDQCGADLKVGERYYSLNMKIGSQYIPTAPAKYHATDGIMSDNIYFDEELSYSIKDANLCEKCGKESIRFIKSVGEKLQKAVE